MKKIIFLLLLITISCSKHQQPIVVTTDDYHHAVDKLTEVMVHDIFSPPVSSRVYAHSNIAAYEILAVNNETLSSLSSEFKDFHPIPKAENPKINLPLAALIAHLEVGKQLMFSEDRVATFQDSLYNHWKNQNERSFLASKEYGMKVVEHLKTWISSDNYKETRTMPKFSVYSEDPSRWQPTPPSYMNSIEPHWSKIRTFAIDSAEQFKPKKHPEFSLKKDSEFYKQLMEVYHVKLEMQKAGDISEKVKIAKFWDCNPYVSTQRGHLMFATKKITPGGHWIGICKIASKKEELDLESTVYAYTMTSIAIADGFISAWDEKYRSNLIRPETLINRYIDDSWKPVLQTPPFPEYTSGHSVVSGAAAVVLTRLFGDNFYFDDDTEVAYGLPIRSFASFHDAANEAALSRLYGGIHYRAAIDEGLAQGKKLGAFVVDDLEIQSLSQ